MGMLDRWFGGRKDYPPLPADNEAQARLDEVKDQLEELARRVMDPMEVVLADHEAYVFLGKPPKSFGMAWIHDGKVSGLKELASEKKLSQVALGQMVNRLGRAYQLANDTPRFSTEIGGRQLVVIPSSGLQYEVHQIIESATQL